MKKAQNGNNFCYIVEYMNSLDVLEGNSAIFVPLWGVPLLFVAQSISNEFLSIVVLSFYSVATWKSRCK